MPNVPLEPAPGVEDVVSTSLKPVLGGEPALVVGFLIAVLVTVLSVLGVVDVATATGIIVSAAPIVSGLLTRLFVHPVTK